MHMHRLADRTRRHGRRMRVKKKPTILRTPDNIAAELAAAERELKRPPGGKRQTVGILPKQIKTRPELFQPRGFYTRDPPLVVKLGGDWVCVDGHHRVAAYLKQPKGGWRATIACQWFAGTAREAVDESVRRNDVVKLEMRRSDQWEAAWQRVVLGWGSKKQICRLTGASDGLVAQMRRVVAAHASKDAFGREFRKKLPSIKDATWSLARASHLNLSPAEFDERKAAAKLARELQNRLHGKLSENKKITAMALALYDPALPEPLASELRRVKSALADEDEGVTWDEPTAGDCQESCV
jgi:hypothetical protein